MEFKTLVTPSSPRECRLQHWKLLGGERDKYRVTSHPEFYPKLNGMEKPWIQNNPIITSLSLLLSPIALHPSGKGAGAIFNSVLLLCLLPLLPLLFLLFNYSPIKGGLPTPNPNIHLSPQCPCTSTLFIPKIPRVGTTFPSHPSCFPPT